jgi:hypothetical protein
VDVLDAEIDQDVADDLPHVLVVVDNQHRQCLHELVDAAVTHRIMPRPTRRSGASAARLKAGPGESGVKPIWKIVCNPGCAAFGKN